MKHEVRRSSPPPCHLRESGSGVCMTKQERERERESVCVYVCEGTGNKRIDLVGRMTTYETCLKDDGKAMCAMGLTYLRVRVVSID